MTPRGVSRRTALRALGASAGVAVALPWLSDEGLLAFEQVQRTGAAVALGVLTPAQYATVEALVEAIIPADERSPGAKEARVADYVDLVLSETDESVREQWLDGLTLLNAEATSRFGAAFVRLDAGQIETFLTDLARNEKVVPAVALAAQPARTPLEAFFAIAKRASIHGYYSSEIGIHKELHYKGNQILAEFVGCHTQETRNCPHCGQEAQA